MQTRSKLVALELISGIFGWIWILAGLAILVFIVLSLFFDGTWWNVLWAFITSSIAKWLARGFEDSKNRVAYEAELIDRGYSPEEAGKAWLDSYSGGPDILAEAQKPERSDKE